MYQKLYWTAIRFRSLCCLWDYLVNRRQPSSHQTILFVMWSTCFFSHFILANRIIFCFYKLNQKLTIMILIIFNKIILPDQVLSYGQILFRLHPPPGCKRLLAYWCSITHQVWFYLESLGLYFPVISDITAPYEVDRSENKILHLVIARPQFFHEATG